MRCIYVTCTYNMQYNHVNNNLLHVNINNSHVNTDKMYVNINKVHANSPVEIIQLACTEISNDNVKHITFNI